MRDRAYAVLGFRAVPPQGPPRELESRRLSNPDAVSHRHAVQVQTVTGRAWVVPFLTGEGPEHPPAASMRVELAVLEDGRLTGELIRPEDTDYSAIIGRNTTYDIHPEEAVADNFGFVVLRALGARHDVEDQDALDALEEALRGEARAHAEPD